MFPLCWFGRTEMKSQLFWTLRMESKIQTCQMVTLHCIDLFVIFEADISKREIKFGRKNKSNFGKYVIITIIVIIGFN